MNENGDQHPLILTAQLPDDLHRWATALRTAHFPPERNYLEAHVTLFHAIPAQCEDELVSLCKQLASEFLPPSAELIGMMSLGRGTALKIESPSLLNIRSIVADHLHGMLTAQDQHSPRLHVTIQNKVSSQEAKALQSELAGSVEPRPFQFKGLALFHYRGGPWQAVRDFRFRGRAIP